METGRSQVTLTRSISRSAGRSSAISSRAWDVRDPVFGGEQGATSPTSQQRPLIAPPRFGRLIPLLAKLFFPLPAVPEIEKHPRSDYFPLVSFCPFVSASKGRSRRGSFGRYLGRTRVGKAFLVVPLADGWDVYYDVFIKD